MNIEPAYFMFNIRKFAEGSDIAMSLIKGFFFGIIIVFISCREWMARRERRGRREVGRPPRKSVVITSLPFWSLISSSPCS